MKTTLLAAAFAVIGTPMLADGLSFGGEVETEYNMDAEKMTVILTPETKYEMGAATFAVSSDLSIYDSSAVDHWTAMNLMDEGSRPDIDVEVTYKLQDGLTVYGETGWDIDAKDRKDVIVGVNFAF
jgi:hypothetical protein